MIKVEGEVSREQKELLLEIFQTDFKLSELKAIELLSGSSHLYGNGLEIKENPQYVLKRSITHFTHEQMASVSSLLTKVANYEGQETDRQTAFIKQVNAEFKKVGPKSAQW